jgi:hypothetical protein
VSAAELSPHALVINSFSKFFCMTGWRVGWMVVPEPLVRPIERLQQNLSISVPTLSQIAAEAAFEGREEMEAIKRGYQENRRILIEGLPKAGLTKFLPADGAFYLYADVSDFTSDSFEFASLMLEKAHVAATPGVDFDPIHGRAFIRFSYARSADEMHEAVTRIEAAHHNFENGTERLRQSRILRRLQPTSAAGTWPRRGAGMARYPRHIARPERQARRGHGMWLRLVCPLGARTRRPVCGRVGHIRKDDRASKG